MENTLWDKVFEVYYDSFYEEMIAEALIKKWSVFDSMSKFLALITASGSTIAGISLWNDPEYKIIWVIISVLAALVVAANLSMKVAENLKHQMNTEKEFRDLRIAVETLRMKMEIENINTGTCDSSNNYDQLMEYKNKYRELSCGIENDILKSKKFGYKIQKELDDRLEDIIEINGEKK